jgi:hypothetical protein
METPTRSTLPRLRLNSTDDFQFNDSWNAAFEGKDLSKGEAKADAIVDAVDGAVSSAQQHYAAVNDFYEANSATIKGVVDILDDNVDMKAVEGVFNHFEEVAGVLVKGLDELAKLHPFVGAAVLAFKLVYTLDLTRRENNKRVMVIKVQMKEMMVVLFQLRHVKDSSEVGPDGSSIAGRMQSLMASIAQEIRACGSVCDAYLKKGFFCKFLALAGSVFHAKVL